MTFIYTSLKHLAIILIILFALPTLVSAEVSWGAVWYTPQNSTTSQARPFEHVIIQAEPRNSHVSINAEITHRPNWFGAPGSDTYAYLYLSKDDTWDQSDIALARVLLDPNTIDVGIAFNAYVDVGDPISVQQAQYTNNNEFNTTSPAFPESLLADNIGVYSSIIDINDSSLDLYACASRTNPEDPSQEISLGCGFLKKQIITGGSQGNTNPPPPGGGGTNPGPPGAAGEMQFDKLKNPLCATTGDSTICSEPIESVTDFIERILNIVVMIGMPIVVLALIWAGFLYVKAQGNSEKIKEAHTTLLWTVVGAGLLMGSWAIANALRQTVVDIGTGAGLSTIIQDDRELG